MGIHIFVKLRWHPLYWDGPQMVSQPSYHYNDIPYMNINLYLYWNRACLVPSHHLQKQCSKLSQKSCQSSCLESQIINIKLRKIFKKVPGPPPKLSASGRRTGSNLEHWQKHWFTINWTPKNKFQGNLDQYGQIFIQQYGSESDICKQQPFSSGLNMSRQHAINMPDQLCFCLLIFSFLMTKHDMNKGWQQV